MGSDTATVIMAHQILSPGPSTAFARPESASQPASLVPTSLRQRLPKDASLLWLQVPGPQSFGGTEMEAAHLAVSYQLHVGARPRARGLSHQDGTVRNCADGSVATEVASGSRGSGYGAVASRSRQQSRHSASSSFEGDVHVR